MNEFLYFLQICLKSFKRKEQLTLHIVIHSGEKKHVCQECGKGKRRYQELFKRILIIIAIIDFFSQTKKVFTAKITYASTLVRT